MLVILTISPETLQEWTLGIQKFQFITMNPPFYREKHLSMFNMDIENELELER